LRGTARDAAVVVFSTADLFLMMHKRLPFRKATFLTIATAVRGNWWDRELFGGLTFGSRQASEADIQYSSLWCRCRE
jgi:hypothetical protein